MLTKLTKEIRNNGNVFSVYDFIRFVCKYSEGGARKQYKRVLERYPEVAAFCHYLKFKGSGQRETPVTDRKGLIKLLGILPGTTGKRFRHEQAEIIHEYLYEPEKLAKKAINRIEDEDKLDDVKTHLVSRQKYLNHYHGVHNQLQEHGCEDIHHATYNKKANIACGVEKGKRNFMNREQELMMTIYQSSGELALIQRPEVKEWHAVNVATGAGNRVLGQAKGE